MCKLGRWFEGKNSPPVISWRTGTECPICTYTIHEDDRELSIVETTDGGYYKVHNNSCAILAEKFTLEEIQAMSPFELKAALDAANDVYNIRLTKEIERFKKILTRKSIKEKAQE